MRSLLAFILFFTITSAQADIVFAPGISYSKQTEENAGTTSETQDTTYDIRLGYLHPSGLYLGGMYSSLKVNDFSGTSTAATIGFNHYSGFFAMFHYHLMGEMDRSSTVTMTDGMGPQIDVGWVFPLNQTFFIGPQMTYRSINYKKLDSSGVTSEIDITRTSTMPYVTLWFKF